MKSTYAHGATGLIIYHYTHWRTTILTRRQSRQRKHEHFDENCLVKILDDSSKWDSSKCLVSMFYKGPGKQKGADQMPKVILTTRCHQSHSTFSSRQNAHSSKCTRQIGNSSKWDFAKTVSRQISSNQSRTARSTLRDKFNPPSGPHPLSTDPKIGIADVHQGS